MVTEIELFLRLSYFSSSLSMHFSLLFSTDYPTWMASDVDFKRLYLFKKPEGCCNKWFVTAVDACVNSIIQGKYDILPCPTNRPECNQTSSVTNATAEVLSKWYPSIWEFKCKNDQKMPEYMLIEGYREWYLFNSEEQCCASFGYCWAWVLCEKNCSREIVKALLRFSSPLASNNKPTWKQAEINALDEDVYSIHTYPTWWGNMRSLLGVAR